MPFNIREVEVREFSPPPRAIRSAATRPAGQYAAAAILSALVLVGAIVYAVYVVIQSFVVASGVDTAFLQLSTAMGVGIIAGISSLIFGIVFYKTCTVHDEIIDLKHRQFYVTANNFSLFIVTDEDDKLLFDETTTNSFFAHEATIAYDRVINQPFDRRAVHIQERRDVKLMMIELARSILGDHPSFDEREAEVQLEVRQSLRKATMMYEQETAVIAQLKATQPSR